MNITEVLFEHRNNREGLEQFLCRVHGRTESNIKLCSDLVCNDADGWQKALAAAKDGGSAIEAVTEVVVNKAKPAGIAFQSEAEKVEQEQDLREIFGLAGV